MSSNIKVQRICQHCGREFIAKTTVTRYCGDDCAKRAYKVRERNYRIDYSNADTLQKKVKPLEEIKVKEFLTVSEVATLLNCSVRTVYCYIDSKKINAVNLSQRLTRIKRSEIDKLFESPPPDTSQQNTQVDISDYYSILDIQNKYKISETTLRNIIKRNNIPKIKNGGKAYVLKNSIDQQLSK